jgi:hypothetical protein
LQHTDGFSATSGNTRIIKNFPNSILGEQSGIFKNTPLNNFSTVQPIFTSNMAIDSAKQGKQNESIKFFKI